MTDSLIQKTNEKSSKVAKLEVAKQIINFGTDNLNVCLGSDAKLPTRGSSGSAGYDLYAAESVTILAGTRALIKTNVCMAIPPTYYGRIADRSGLAYKNGITVLGGVIDSDYRGEIGVILHNTDSKNNFTCTAGDRIAQIIFERCYEFNLAEQTLSNTTRGSGAYGSTGVK